MLKNTIIKNNKIYPNNVIKINFDFKKETNGIYALNHYLFCIKE